MTEEGVTSLYLPLGDFYHMCRQVSCSSLHLFQLQKKEVDKEIWDRAVFCENSML